MVFFIQDMLDYSVLAGSFLVLALLALLCFSQRAKNQPDGFWGKLFVLLKNNAYRLVFIVSVSATIGSLFLSEVIKLPPCDLCWFQRVFMYSIALLFLVALLKRERILKPYALTLAIIGGLIALYQYFLQIGTMLNLEADQFIPCSATNISCSIITNISFGFITIPMSSLVAFALIVLFLVYDRKS